MIDEKKLIAYLEKERDYWHHSTAPYSLEVMCMYSDTIDFVNEQPKVGEWIPCSERLPESSYDVEVTCKNGARGIGFYSEVRWYNSMTYAIADVIAWKEPSEPWEGENENEEQRKI